MISFSNEMSIMADHLGEIDTAQAFRILHLDKRWSGCDVTSYIYPGCGYGGYCLPKDTNALYAVSKSVGFDAKILSQVIQTNDHMPMFIADRIEKASGYRTTCKIGMLGLSFKPGSDDVREAPSAKIIAELYRRGYQNFICYDPVANAAFASYYGFHVQYMDTLSDMIRDAELLVIATAWEEFRSVPSMTDKPLIDCRYML